MNFSKVRAWHLRLLLTCLLRQRSQQIKSITMPRAIPTGTLQGVRAGAAAAAAPAVAAALDADFYGARGTALKPTCRIRNNSITAQHHN